MKGAHRQPFAAPLAKALCAGGIPVIEVTLRNDTALESLRRIKAENPAMLAGAGTVLTVLCLLLTAGYNDTAYYPSLTDPQSSLTIYNSSSSRFTLYVMSIVSLLIPFVVAYIWYVWRSMNRVRISEKELGKEDHPY